MQWTNEKCLSGERTSNPRNSLWQNGLFRYQVHQWTKTVQKFSKIRLWIIFCPKWDLQRHKYNNLDNETCPDICNQFFKPCGRTNFPLQLITLLYRLLEHWKVWRRKVKHKWSFYSLITRQLRLCWAASWRNSPNVIIDEITRGLAWFKMILITKFVPQFNSYRYKKIN